MLYPSRVLAVDDRILPENPEHGIPELPDAFENLSQTDLPDTEAKLIQMPDALDEAFRNTPEDGQMTIRAYFDALCRCIHAGDHLPRLWAGPSSPGRHRCPILPTHARHTCRSHRSLCLRLLRPTWTRHRGLHLAHLRRESPTASRRARNVFFGLAASAHMHVHKVDVTAASHRGSETELERGVLADPMQELGEAHRLRPWDYPAQEGRVRTGERHEHGGRRSIRLWLISAGSLLVWNPDFRGS